MLTKSSLIVAKTISFSNFCLDLEYDLCVPRKERFIASKTRVDCAGGGGGVMTCLSASITEKEVDDLAMGMVDWLKELQNMKRT